MQILISEKTKIGALIFGWREWKIIENLPTLLHYIHSGMILVELWYLKLQIIIRVKLICTMKGKPEVRGKKLEHAFSYLSHQWRTWGACFIQIKLATGWGYKKKDGMKARQWTTEMSSILELDLMFAGNTKRGDFQKLGGVSILLTLPNGRAWVVRIG